MALLQGATIFDYCERGLSTAFWAEPLNAVTNGGFILAALAGAAMIAWRNPGERSLAGLFRPELHRHRRRELPLSHRAEFVNTALARRAPSASSLSTVSCLRATAFRGRERARHRACHRSVRRPYGGGVPGALLGRPCGASAGCAAGAQAKCLNGSLGYGPALLSMGLIAIWLASSGIRRPA